MRNIEKRTSRLGPGGLKCGCCRFDSKQKVVRVLNRDNRREAKRNIQRELNGILCSANGDYAECEELELHELELRELELREKSYNLIVPNVKFRKGIEAYYKPGFD